MDEGLDDLNWWNAVLIGTGVVSVVVVVVVVLPMSLFVSTDTHPSLLNNCPKHTLKANSRIVRMIRRNESREEGAEVKKKVIIEDALRNNKRRERDR